MSSSSNVGAFGRLDERLVAGSVEPGVLVVVAPPNAHAAILAYAGRCLRASGSQAIEIGARQRLGTPMFREVATHLGIAKLPTDPSSAAEVIARQSHARGRVIVAPLPPDGTWDRAVATAIAHQAEALLVVFVTAEDTPWDDELQHAVFEIVTELTPDDRRRWLCVLADDEEDGVPATDLVALERWWSSARRAAPSTTPALENLGSVAQQVARCLAMADRSVPIASLTAIDEKAPAAAAELVEVGLATSRDGFISIASTTVFDALEHPSSNEARLAAARILTAQALATGDPWADARAAELLLDAGAFEAADDAIARALHAVDDSQASDEIAARWFNAVLPIGGDPGLMLRRSAASRTLDAGEANDALRWCESAASLSPEDPTIALLMARVLTQLGDLVAARVYLQKAQRTASTDELYARIVAELAEVSYLAADHEEARAYANTAIALATTVSTRLAARNTLGKIHLAAGAWDVCDEHFADDATTAHSAGERTAELRARLNRAIALLSKGLLEDARAVLERVLEDGARFGEDRARAYALHNLAVIAEKQHDFGRALECWEASARFPVTLCGRISSARMLANLAELRLRLGLVDHADHTVAFGRRVLGARASTGAAANFSMVASRIALVRGNSTLARREIDRAILDAGRSADTRLLPDAFLVSARVAIEDGDVQSASEALSRAEPLATSRRNRAELALLKAIQLRASGCPSLDAANEALSLARLSDEEDLLIEIYGLLAAMHLDTDGMEVARAHCARGIGACNQITIGLSPEARAAFLAKPDVCALFRLQAVLAPQEPNSIELPQVSIARPTSSKAREIVGDHPHVRNLMLAIRKVARTNSMVLIHGESGTGKELVAEAIHGASDRAAGPLVSVNCGALVEALLLSELFGHEKGSFTGAASRRRGRFELAEGGTLFLDEIGDISTRTQVALLRVLQEKTFERVGGSEPIHTNARIVCATHRDLKAMVERGEFREDLFYRLSGITLEVPALRTRLGDIPKIAQHLIHRIATERNERPKPIAPDAIDLLQRHQWPGNIRELENALRAASLFAEGNVITIADLTENVEDLRGVAQSTRLSRPPHSARGAAMQVSRETPSAPPPGDEIDDEVESSVPDGESTATDVAYAQVRRGAVSLSSIKRQIERDCIARALSETNGNITRAAALLGVKRPRLSQLAKQYGLSMTTEVNK